MTPHGSFSVDGDRVSSDDLLKALKRNRIPTNTPLVIEIPADTAMDIKRRLAGRLATAGYKPVFHTPQRAIVTVNSRDTDAPRASKPAMGGAGSPPP